MTPEAFIEETAKLVWEWDGPRDALCRAIRALALPTGKDMDPYAALRLALPRLEEMHRWAIGRDAELGRIEEAIIAVKAAL